MSVQTQIDRIASAKAAIKTAIEGKGVTVPDATLLDGMAALIESIEAGVGGSVKDVFYVTYTLSNPSSYMYISKSFVPDCVVVVGDVNGSSSNAVGLAVHVEDENGDVYQEKWRYQSTKYLVGTTATDGSLFTISKSGDSYIMSINSRETSFGKLFAASRTYKIFAAKIF